MIILLWKQKMKKIYLMGRNQDGEKVWLESPIDRAEEV